MTPGSSLAKGHTLVANAGGRVTRDLHIINGFGADMTAPAARAPRPHPGRARGVPQQRRPSQGAGVDDDRLATAYNHSIQTPTTCGTLRGPATASASRSSTPASHGDLPDFRVSQTDTTLARHRLARSSTRTPRRPDDTYGHGTHVAGIIAGNGATAPTTDPLAAATSASAPDANLISIKASDDDGNATVLDVIDGLQFAVDHKADYNIRVVNLSLRVDARPSPTRPTRSTRPSRRPGSSGIVVVAAAGNRGTAGDAVSYAPATTRT